MGYIPNLTARNLGKQVSNAIGIILPPLDSKERLGNPFYLETIETINEEARQSGMTVAIATALNFDSLLENVKQMHRQKQVDGFILTYSDNHDPIIRYLMEEDVPFTLIGQPYNQEQKITYVDNDNQLLGKQATEYLINHHHQKILFVTNTTQENVYFERYFGYQKAMMLANLEVKPAVTFQHPEDYVNLEQLLKIEKPTALVVIDDLFAMRIIQLLNLYQYQVPDDLSIISFNNSIFATLVHPYLTSIDVDVAELGKMATQSLIHKLNDNQQTSGRMVVPHQLIKRETVIDLEQK